MIKPGGDRVEAGCIESHWNVNWQQQWGVLRFDCNDMIGSGRVWPNLFGYLTVKHPRSVDRVGASERQRDRMNESVRRVFLTEISHKLHYYIIFFIFLRLSFRIHVGLLHPWPAAFWSDISRAWYIHPSHCKGVTLGDRHPFSANRIRAFSTDNQRNRDGGQLLHFSSTH